MTELDDPQTYLDLDPGGMLSHLYRLPQQCRLAWRQATGLKLPPTYRRVNRVVVAGMGGSAIGGDLAAGLAALEGLNIRVHRDYGLPLGMDARTLLILSSYSGETEETLSAYEAALSTPTKKLAVTSRGRLKALAADLGIPVLPMDYAAPPRAALGYGFIGLVGILHNLGLVKDKSADMEEMLATLDAQTLSLGEGVPLASNPAKRLANQFFGRLAVIYGGGFLEGVARRWKTQLNENAKAWAISEAFPELNHNAVVGYQFPEELGTHVFIALLHSPLLHPRIQLRYQATSEILAQRKVAHQILEGEGQSPLSQMMSLILLGDYVSYYLALLYGVDPSPVAVIDHLKRQLARK